MSRLWDSVTRRPPVVGNPGVPFGFTVRAEAGGWTVFGHGADGRRLGRELKGLSDPAQATLVATPTWASDPDQLARLADAWVDACRREVTNSDVLMAFSDAAAEILPARSP